MKRTIKALAAAILLAGCTSCGSNRVSGMIDRDVIVPKDGYAEGGLRDSLRTAWFDLTVNNAETAETYGSITPAEGETLLIVNITLVSTFDSDTVMFDTDFQAQWGGEGEEDYRFPVTAYDPSLTEKGMLEEEYVLSPQETVTGNLVFSVPAGYETYSLSFMEYFELFGDESGSDNAGDLFFVYFNV